MPHKPEAPKGNAPAAVTAEALDAKPSNHQRNHTVNSIAHSPVAPALAFSFEDQQLRVVMIDAEPWFVASDVCALLDIKNVTQAVSRLDTDELAMFNIGSQRESHVISEPGLYSLILGSRKPVATPFKRWVTHEVLPSIRKTGGYSVKRMVPRDRQISAAERLLARIERSESKFARDGYLQLAELAFADLGLSMPDKQILRPLQMDLTEGSAA